MTTIGRHERRLALCRTAMAASLAIALVACDSVATDEPAAAAPSGEASAPPKPVVENVQWIDYLFPPDSIAEMMADAAAVVVARYEGTYVTKDTGGNAPGRFIETSYTFTVQEVVKPHAALRGTVELWLPVGEFEDADRIVRSRTEDVATPVQGHSYVVFLTVSRLTGSLIGAWGPSSLYDITGERVAPTATQSPHAGRPVREFLDEVRSAASR